MQTPVRTQRLLSLSLVSFAALRLRLLVTAVKGDLVEVLVSGGTSMNDVLGSAATEALDWLGRRASLRVSTRDISVLP